MTPTQTETDFLKLNEQERKVRLLEILKKSAQGFLHFTSLAGDIGIDYEQENWASSELGRAFYTALRALADNDKQIRWVQDEIVQLT